MLISTQEAGKYELFPDIVRETFHKLLQIDFSILKTPVCFVAVLLAVTYYRLGRVKWLDAQSGSVEAIEFLDFCWTSSFEVQEGFTT